MCSHNLKSIGQFAMFWSRDSFKSTKDTQKNITYAILLSSPPRKFFSRHIDNGNLIFRELIKVIHIKKFFE
jgi:hypothetical protein